jgi:hypothetical protein
LINHEAENTQAQVVIDSNVSEAINEYIQSQAKYAEQHSGDDEYQQLSSNIHDFSLILIVLILGLFVHVIQLQTPFVY